MVSPGRLSPHSQLQHQGWALQRDLLSWEGKAAGAGHSLLLQGHRREDLGVLLAQRAGHPLGKRCHSSLCGPCPPMVKSILPSQPACPGAETG